MNKLPLTLLLLAFLAPSALNATRSESTPPPTIDVTGEGEVKVEPDQVILRLTIETFGPKLKEVRQEISDRTLNLMNVLKSKGVKPADVQTEMVQITPHYDFDKAKRKFIEYIARKSFVITLKDLEGYGTVLEGALNAGVDRVDGLQFQTSNLKTLKDNARKMAMQDAKRKAELLAGAVNQAVGKAVKISEQQTDFPQPVMMRAAAMENFKGPGGADDTIAPGEISIKSSVFVQFELR